MGAVMSGANRGEFGNDEGMNEWREANLDEVVKFQRGHDLTVAAIAEGIYPVAGSNGIIGYHNRSTTKGPGITLGRSGNSIGVAHYYEKDFWAHNTTLYSTVFFESLPKYVFYFLKTIDFAVLNSGSAVPSLNRNHIHNIRVKVPQLSEQKAIASVLSSLDDKIDLLHRQNATLEAMAETLFRQWFVEEAQEDWEEVELGNMIETTSGGTPSRNKMEYYENGEFYWVKSKELSGSFILDTEEKITKDALKNSSAKILPANSILIAMYGATVGEYAIIAEQMTCNQAVCALKPNENYPYTFLFILIKISKEKLINMAVGSAQQNISQLLIKQLPVPTSNPKIVEFDNVIRPSFEKIKSNIKQIRILEKLRDNLLPKLMSGEVRVAV
jgi:type I restriction enzyme, S subunit